MGYFRLALKPGIDKQNTEYGAEGGWIDGDYIRFRYGLPEKIGGWAQFSDEATYLVGQATAIHTWNDLDGVPFLIIGTNRKLYAYQGGTWADVTPLRETTTAGTTTFDATNGSNIVTVMHTNHEAEPGDFVTFSGANTLGGNVTAAILNQEFEILNTPDNDTYTIQVAATANSSDSGNGGTATIAAYQIPVGQDRSYFDLGWGVGPYGEEAWGTPRTGTLGAQLFSRVWQLDNFGEDVVCQIVDGSAYLFDTSLGLNQRAALINGAPTKSRFSLISTPDRHFVCLGTEATVGTPSTQDPMFVRFSDQETLTVFSESATNTAGGQRLTDGSMIMSGIRSRGQILIFTDTSLHGMQFVGPPYTFGFQQLGANCGCIGAHAAVDVNGVAFWMGPEAFYMFDGTVKKLPCTVQDYVFKDFNKTQGTVVQAGVNSQFNEVTWWYASESSNYINRFVTFNYLENAWSTGSMARSAWTDIGTYLRPLASEYLINSTEPTISTINGLTAGRCLLYFQEDGFNQADGTPIFAYIKSGYFDIGDGDNMMYMRRFIPDFKNQVGNLTVRLLLRPYPQANAVPSSLDPYPITPTTQKVDTRARGRQISLQIESSELDTNWRFGTMRVDIQPDGSR